MSKNDSLKEFFIEILDNNFAFHAKLFETIREIQIAPIAHEKGLKILWLERKFNVAFITFKNNNIVPWRYRNRRVICIFMTKSMICFFFFVYPIYREENYCTHKICHYI